MHNAPPVVYPVGRFVWSLWLIGGVGLLSFSGLAVWHGVTAPDRLQCWMAWSLWFVSTASAIAYAVQEQSPPGSLVWRGEGWFWREDSSSEWPVQVRVLVDGGEFMLLVYERDETFGSWRRRGRFAVLFQSTMPSFWHGFRCAVYSRPMGEQESTHRQTSRFEV